MKFFIDTADIPEIEQLIPSGLIDGVTTNPSLIAKTLSKLVKNIQQQKVHDDTFKCVK